MKNSKTRAMCALSLFTALICVGAFIKIPFVIPITLQLLFTNTAALTLGKKGALSVLIYFFLGMLGLPVFSSGGGIISIVSPTFGFNIGFLIGAFFAGMIAEKKHSVQALALASAVNMFFVYLCGGVYFHIIQNIYLSRTTSLFYTLYVCVIPFVIPDIIKCMIGIVLAQKIKNRI